MLAGQDLLQSLDTKRRGWMMSGAERVSIRQSQRARRSGRPRWGNQNPADANGSWTEQPDRSVIPRYGGRNSDTGHPQCAGNGLRRHTVGKNGRERTVSRFDIERS